MTDQSESTQSSFDSGDNFGLDSDGVRVLVTGATGLIGQPLVRRLIADGHSLCCIARPSSAPRLAGLPVDVVVGDLLDGPPRLPEDPGFDAVVHLAAVGDFGAVGFRACQRMLGQSCTALENLFRGLGPRGPHRVVHFSSLAAVGFQAATVVDNQTTARPDTPYGWSKLAGELTVRGLAQQRGASCVVLRPALVYGPGDATSDLLKALRLIRRGVFPIFGRGDNVMSPLVYLDDLIEITARMVTSEVEGALICARNEGFTVDEFVQTASQIFGRPFGGIHVNARVAAALCRVLEVPFWLLNKSPPITAGRVRNLSESRRFARVHEALDTAIGYHPATNVERGLANVVRTLGL